MQIIRDVDKAKKALTNHTIALCRGNDILLSVKKGIAPMMDFISKGLDLQGYSVADMVVGKAVAMLFVKAKIKEVYAKTISTKALQILEKYNVPYSYDILTENIINRKGDGLCPMEQAVLHTDDIDEGYTLIKNKLAELNASKQ